MSAALLTLKLPLRRATPHERRAAKSPCTFKFAASAQQSSKNLI